MRIVGQVTQVATSTRSVTAAIAPMTPQTNGDWPCVRVQGWKWSETDTKSKPASSARRAQRTIARGSSSSEERL